jgi:hypothetical protein
MGHKICFDLAYGVFLKHFSQEELGEMWLKMYIGLHLKCPLFMTYFNRTWMLCTVFRKIRKYEIWWKSVQ